MKHKIIFSILLVLASLSPAWSQLTTMHATLSGIGIKSVNGLTAKTQTFATGTTGTDFNISSSGSVHTFNIPTASATNRGLLSTADWTTFNSHFTLPAFTAGSVIFSNGTTLAQDNTNFFFDNTNDRLGIGTNSPSTILHLNGGSNPGVITLESNNAAYMSIFRYSNDVTRPRYETYKARGTKAVPLTVQTGDELAAFDFYGHNGTNFNRNATIYTTVKNISGTDITAQMNFGFGFSGGTTQHYQAFSAAGALFTSGLATTKTPTSLVDVNYDSIGVTQTNSTGLSLTNNSVATVGNQQISPGLRFRGNGWKTSATAASNPVDFRIDLLPVQGSSNPSSRLRFSSDINASGTYTEYMAITSDRGPMSSYYYGFNAQRLVLFNGTSTYYSIIGSSASGNIILLNYAENDFDRLQFGGTSALYPAWKRVTTTLQARLANDSDFTAIQSLYERFGSGTPEGVVTAPVGAVYHRTDGGTGTSFYVKESGTGNTGWVAK